jgi:8-oxo-dGTP diphosphatase
MTPRYGETPQTGRKYRRRPGVYAVLRLDDAILLTHQAAPVPEYQLPGGGIDPGESPLRALHREVFEETGWSIAVQRRLGVYRRYTYMPDYDLWAEKICHIYLARPLRAWSAPSEPGHIAVWAGLDEAPGLLASEGDRAMLLRHIARTS